MSEQERQQAFVYAIQEAERKYGFTVASNLVVDGLGPVMSLRPSYIKPGPISVVPAEGWQVPSEEGDSIS